MLERVDRVQLVVRDRQAAARTFAAVLGAEPVGESESAYLGARRTVLALGQSQVELCEPAGPGRALAHLERWGEGLMTAGFSVADVPALRRRSLTSVRRETGVTVSTLVDRTNVNEYFCERDWEPATVVAPG